jgi:outer membrane protein assembly factor BamE (lipoprotein component of BamABCDE complex)
MKATAVALLACALAAGCVSTGRRVDQAAVQSFTVGVTTAAEVERALGRPNTTTVTNGIRSVSYQHVRASATGLTFVPIVGAFAGGATSHMESVTLTFGPDGRLTDITRTDTDSQVGYVPPQPAHPAPRAAGNPAAH